MPIANTTGSPITVWSLPVEYGGGHRFEGTQLVAGERLTGKLKKEGFVRGCKADSGIRTRLEIRTRFRLKCHIEASPAHSAGEF